MSQDPRIEYVPPPRHKHDLPSEVAYPLGTRARCPGCKRMFVLRSVGNQPWWDRYNIGDAIADAARRRRAAS